MSHNHSKLIYFMQTQDGVSFELTIYYNCDMHTDSIIICNHFRAIDSHDTIPAIRMHELNVASLNMCKIKPVKGLMYILLLFAKNYVFA